MTGGHAGCDKDALRDCGGARKLRRSSRRGRSRRGSSRRGPSLRVTLDVTAGRRAGLPESEGKVGRPAVEADGAGEVCEHELRAAGLALEVRRGLAVLHRRCRRWVGVGVGICVE